MEFRYSVLANECTVLVLYSGVLAWQRSCSPTQGPRVTLLKVVGGEKVQNLLDCNPDEPEGKAARTERMNEKNRVP